MSPGPGPTPRRPHLRPSSTAGTGSRTSRSWPSATRRETAMSDPTVEPTTTTAPQGSVFLTGQVISRVQRRGRYTKESIAHPGKMLPSIARYLIRTFTDEGEWVCDPMAGIATTVVEAMHLDRHGIGVEYEARWAGLAARNIGLAASQGARGT